MGSNNNTSYQFIKPVGAPPDGKNQRVLFEEPTCVKKKNMFDVSKKKLVALERTGWLFFLMFEKYMLLLAVKNWC